MAAPLARFRAVGAPVGVRELPDVFLWYSFALIQKR
jgi:hypothetical protein